jgi:hypothetical protein
MAALRAVNLGVRFLLELAALAGFAYWGWRLVVTLWDILWGVTTVGGSATADSDIEHQGREAAARDCPLTVDTARNL